MSTRILARRGSAALATVSVVALAGVLAVAPVGGEPANAAGETGTVVVHLWFDDAGAVAPIDGYVTLTNLVGGAEFGTLFVNGVGDYETAAIPTGDYLVQARFPSCTACVSDVWAGDTALRSQAQIVSVGTGQSLVEITTHPGAKISGALTYDPPLGEWSMLAEAHLIDPSTGRLSGWYASGAADDGDYTIPGLPDGDYLVRYHPQAGIILGSEYAEDAGWLSDAQVVTISGGADVSDLDATFGDTDVLTSRFSGADRFAMAVGISQEYSPGVDTVYITNGLNFPDALSAGPVAARAGGPILLVTPSGIPAVVAEELERLQPASVVVVGGPNSVNPSVVTALGAYSDDVTRIDGADRFAASRNLVADSFDAATTVYLATGNNFADALAAGGAAANEDAPVILVNGWSTSVDPQTAALLAGLSTTRIVVAGGPASFTPELFDSLAALPGIQEIVRRTGATRFEAAAAINEASFPMADTVMLATGANFPDALAGGPLAGAWGAPMFLVQHDCVPFDALWRIINLQPRHIVLLGGPNSLSAAVESLPMCPI